MFFNNRDKDTKPAATPAKISSLITRDSKFEGNITTGDSVEINGDFIGDIDSEKEIIINEHGSVTGTIKADRVVTEGKITGKVICNTFKGDKKSLTKDSIEAISVTIMGEFDGVIKCDELNVQESGVVRKTVQAKSVEVAGKIEGDIACETLSTTMHAKIKGKLFVNKLQNNGGTIDGSIGEYKDILNKNIEESKKEQSTKNKKDKVEKIIAEKEKELAEN